MARDGGVCAAAALIRLLTLLICRVSEAVSTLASHLASDFRSPEADRRLLDFFVIRLSDRLRKYSLLDDAGFACGQCSEKYISDEFAVRIEANLVIGCTPQNLLL